MLYNGQGRVPLDYVRFCYCRAMGVPDSAVTAMLRDTPGMFGRHLHYLDLEAASPRKGSDS